MKLGLPALFTFSAYGYCYETKGTLSIDFENGYVAFEDIPQGRRPVKKHQSSIMLDCKGNFDENEDFDNDEDEKNYNP